MKAGVWNLAFGLVAIIAGATGKYVLPFTGSSTALVIAGAAVAVLGVVQLLRSRGR
jgi:uncharacterized membrane protein YgaE (UPF0421/DUF939 family)